MTHSSAASAKTAGGSVSPEDREYMRRLGEFKAASKRDALAEHRALSVKERLLRGLALSRRQPFPNRPRREQKDLPAFFERAKQLGLYKS